VTPDDLDPLGADDVTATRDRILAFLRPLSDRDWHEPIPDLEWDCEFTLRHAVNAQIIYGAHLASRSTRRLVRAVTFDASLDVHGLLDSLEAYSSALSAVLRDAPAEARGWHNSGMTDATGFAAIACDELLIHTWDIGRGLGESFALPGALAGRIVARIFPMWLPIEAASDDALLWCNGRIALPERPRLDPDWGWWSRPLDEWDGTDPDA
jgi:uncharacterized protein (TIGR03083 family)